MVHEAGKIYFQLERGGASLPRLFPSHITEDMLWSPFRPAAEICRFNPEELFFVIPVLNPADFKIVLCRDKLKNLSCPKILAAIGSADDKSLMYSDSKNG